MRYLLYTSLTLGALVTRVFPPHGTYTTLTLGAHSHSCHGIPPRGAGARVFRASGSVDIRKLNAATFGSDLNGSSVNSASTYSAAITTLRTPQGHDPAFASVFANPVKFASYDAALNTVDTSSENGAWGLINARRDAQRAESLSAFCSRI